MAKVVDFNSYDDKELVDQYVKHNAAKTQAETLAKEAKGELDRRGLLVDGETVYGNRYFLKVTSVTTVTFSQAACEKENGKAFMDKYKMAGDPWWKLTSKEITVITSENADKVAAL